MLSHYRPQYQLGVRCSVGGLGHVDKSRGAGGSWGNGKSLHPSVL